MTEHGKIQSHLGTAVDWSNVHVFTICFLNAKFSIPSGSLTLQDHVNVVLMTFIVLQLCKIRSKVGTHLAWPPGGWVTLVSQNES